jgi:hypothetical protein
LFVRLSGDFDSRMQPALHDAFHWIQSPVTIDVGDAWLSSAALAEIVCLSRRVGAQNVTLANASVILRRLIIAMRMDRLLRMVLCEDAAPVAPNTYLGPVHWRGNRPQALSRSARAARSGVHSSW